MDPATARPRSPRLSSGLFAVPRPGEPLFHLPLWMLYPLCFVGVFLGHWNLLRLPYFWDEGGYYIPAALDFFRYGLLIPRSTLTNAHPPLPSMLLAGWWHLSGFVPSGTRTLVALVSAAGLLAIIRLGRDLVDLPTGLVVAALTAIYPVWYAQSTLAHADIFAATFTLWALSFYLPLLRAGSSETANPCGDLLAAGVLFSLAALAKETAIITPVALAALALVERLLAHRLPAAPVGTVQPAAARFPARATALLSPLVPLLLWYGYHRLRTGFFFGNPEFLEYNATANFSAARIALALWHRLLHLLVHMNMLVATLCTASALLMGVLPGREKAWPGREAVRAIVVVLAANLLAFSVLGGALLTRYLLPLYPLLLLLDVGEWRRRARFWWAMAALTAVAFVAGILINPPYAFAPEDNLTYRDMVILHQAAVRLIDDRFPQATVLTAWPADAELQHPELGYTRMPVRTTSVRNFSAEEIARAASEPGAYDTALVFSTKWAPPPGAVDLGRQNRSADSRYFDFHRDLEPAEVAALLHGTVIWERHRRGEWAAVLRFPRAVDASLGTSRAHPASILRP